MRDLIVYGIGVQAELARLYFEKDAGYRVVAFTLEQALLKESTFSGLPLLPFDSIETVIAPQQADLHISVGPVKLGMVRKSLCEKGRELGYRLASYCNPDLRRWFQPSHGDNCFFDHATQMQPWVEVGCGTTLLATTLAHHVRIGNYSFASCSTVGGKVVIEDHVFLGMGSVVREGVHIGEGSIIGMGCLVTKDVEPYSVLSAQGTLPREGLDSREIELFQRPPA